MNRSRRVRRITPALALASALVLAACGTSGGDSSKETDAPTTTAATADTTQTTTADTAEETTTTEAGPPADLVLGFDLSSGDINATRDKYGVNGQNTNLLPEDYYVALMDLYNSKGGIDGHTIVPLNYTAPTGDVPSDVKNQERCETYFNGDTKANVVIGTNDPILNTCANEADAVLFGRGFTGLDQASLDEYAGFVNAQAATFDRVAAAMVDLAVEEGKVTDGTSVGVIYPGCEAQTAVYDNALKPALDAAGAKVSAFAGTCIRTSADEGAAVAEIPNAILQFKSDGVQVVFNLATGFIPVVLMMNEADKQGFVPTWVLSTNNEFGAMSSMNPPADQMANIIAVGWSAALDTFELDPAKLGPKAPDCLAMFAEAGFPAPANLGELASQLDVCSSFYAMEIMLTATPGAIERQPMLDALSASTDDTATLTNSVDWTAGRQPNISYYLAVYDPTTAKFVYQGDPREMPAV